MKLILKSLIAIIAVIIIAVLSFYFISPETALKWVKGLEESRSGLVKKSIIISDHKISYYEGGKGDAIIMLHGFGGDKFNWVRFVKTITKRYRVIIPDLPGFGESTRLDTASYNIMSQVRRVKALTDALNISRFHVIGNSMGGSISGNLAAEYPDKIISLALLDSAGVKSPVMSERTKLINKGFNPLLVHGPEDYDRLLKFVFNKFPYTPAKFTRIYAGIAASRKVAYEKIYNQLDQDSFVLEKKLNRITAPTLIIWGDKDRVIDISSVKIFEKGIKNHKTVIMKDCGHVPMFERPGEAASIYMDFLMKL